MINTLLEHIEECLRKAAADGNVELIQALSMAYQRIKSTENNL